MKPPAEQDSTALRAPGIVCPAGALGLRCFEAQLLATPDLSRETSRSSGQPRPSECLCDADVESGAVASPRVVHSQVDVVALGEREAESDAAAGQRILPGKGAEVRLDLAGAEKRGRAEAPPPLRPPFGLRGDHRAVPVPPGGIPAQIAAPAEHAQIVERRLAGNPARSDVPRQDVPRTRDW